MQTGTVKWFNESKGFGSITPDDGGKDVFVHFNAIKDNGITRLIENQRVQYEVGSNITGAVAANVTVISE